MIFVEYNGSSGKIVASGRCISTVPPSSGNLVVYIQNENEVPMPETHVVRSGVVVLKSEDAESVRLAKILSVDSEAARCMNIASSGYPAQERESWSFLVAECTAYQADGTIGPGIAAECDTDRTPAQLAAMVLSRHDAMLTILGQIKKIRRQHESAIAAMGDDVVALTNYDTAAHWPL